MSMFEIIATAIIATLGTVLGIYVIFYANNDYAPIVDAVEIVRCKNCIYHFALDGVEWCDNPRLGDFEIMVEDNFFCGDGKRKDDE